MSRPEWPTGAGRLYPGIPALVFTIWAVVVPTLFGHRLLNADGDLLRHLRHGEWMLRHRSLIRHDPFSYTMHGKPFVGIEYGSQLLYALTYRVGGLAGVVALATLLIAGSYALLARFLLRRGVDPLLTYLVSIAATVLGATHWAARPHLVTLLAAVALLFFLEPGERRLPLWLLVPFFALWTNLHGGFVYGLTLIALYAAGSLTEWLAGGRDPAWKAKTLHYAAALTIVGAATLINPHGWDLHRHITDFFGEPFLRDHTAEFLSPDFHNAGGKLLLLSLVGVCAALALVPARPSCPRLFLVLGNVAFALQARRNVQLYAVTALPILALHANAAWRQLPDWRELRGIFARDARRGSNRVFMAGVGTALAAVALLHGRVGRWQAVPDRLDPRIFPVGAVAWARAQGLGGRVFHEFIWGGYILYAWPEQLVFIDGGTDFYGPALMRTYLQVVGAQPGWRDTLSARDVSLVLLPAHAPVVAELARDGGWRVRYCDSTAALLQRSPEAAGGPETRRLAACASPQGSAAASRGNRRSDRSRTEPRSRR